MNLKLLTLSAAAAGMLMAASPMVPSSMSTDAGGTKLAIDAYSDGGGVVLINQTGDAKIDNSPMNTLVFKYGTSAKENSTTLVNEVKTLSTTSTAEEKALADKIGNTGLTLAGVEMTIKSCKDVKTANPSATDGLYEIDPDGSGSKPKTQVFCNMTIAGGGWTMVFKPDTIDRNDGTTGAYKTSYSGTVDLIDVVANSSEVIIAYTDTANVLTSPYSFATPTEWKTVHPLTSHQTVATPITYKDIYANTSGNQYLVAGIWTFGSGCDAGINTSGLWGRLCITNTTAPFYASWSVTYTDNCSLSNQSFAATQCSTNRMFVIYAK